MLNKLPAAFFAGLRIEFFNETKAAVAVKQKWFNKNPFGSVYFAVLTMAAEMSTGVLCMANIYKRNPAVSMLVIKTEAVFYKKATGKILFTCLNGTAITALIDDAIATGEGRTIACQSTGRNEAGEIVAEIYCTWSFKVKTIKQ
ncbi:DUF4442 domain-containing protein [Panacibacter ginsenosidivorans]|uniref:DUF4442 domain-containing protein n=1 Tax=Panacibacter ginsenosidivorans TaxID=1813871 RepID=A0A5B8VA91_9BACT|nr:DUF4442 domain-containing protein [Panacibacter ginsenosidivorans]QEC68272.1 DUF4442 domain-containing protein [Panacibacter ginsenosidivorans]